MIKNNNKKYIKYLLFFALMLITLLASAQSGDPEPNSVNAASIIKGIFGVNIENLPGVIVGTGTDGNVIALLSSLFNSMAILAAVVIFSGTFITGGVQTAQEGEFLGRRYSTVWVPMRGGLTLLYLVPMPSGYSFLQGLIMLLVGLGSAGADKAVGELSGFIQNNGGVAPVMIRGVSGLTENIFTAATCQVILNDFVPYLDETQTKRVEIDQENPSIVVQFDSGLISDVVVSAHVNLNGTDDSGLPDGVCGRFNMNVSIPDFAGWQDSSEVKGAVLHLAQQRMLNFIVFFQRIKNMVRAALQSVSVNGDISAIDRNQFGVEYIKAYNTFAGRERQALVGIQNALETNAYAKMQSSQLEHLNDGGWITLGGFYWTISGITDRMNSLMYQTFDSEPLNMRWIPTYLREPLLSLFNPLVDTISAYKHNMDISPGLVAVDINEGNTFGKQNYEQCIENARIIDVKGVVGKGIDVITNNLSHAYSRCITSALYSTMHNKTLNSTGERYDPMIALQHTGHTLVAIGEIGSISAIISRAIGKGVLKGYDGSIAGKTTGLFGSDGLTEAGVVVVEYITTYLLAAMNYLFLVGLALAYYLPALPFIYWINGIVSWILSILVNISASPLWATAHAMPGGEGWVGHGRQGYLMLITSAVRPMLMIIGLVAGILVTRELMGLVSIMFSWYIESSYSTDNGITRGLVSTIMEITIFWVIMIMIGRYGFALINWIPDQALSVIGANGNPIAGQLEQGSNVIEGKLSAAGGMIDKARTGADSTVSKSLEKRAEGSKGGQTNNDDNLFT